MIDVFYCSANTVDRFRRSLAAPCWERWTQICHPSHLYFVGKPPEMPNAEFQGWRRQHAEDHATTPFYIVADDDCMPLGSRFLERCEDLIGRYPEYAVIGARDYAMPYDGDEVEERGTAGGLNIVRKGIIEVPPFDGMAWTSAQQREQIYAKGYKVGLARDIRRNHFGEGFSTVWPDGYASGKTQVGYLDGAGCLV